MGSGEEPAGAEAMSHRKPVAALTAADMQAFPVWEYVGDELPNEDETWVTPVASLPVRDLSNRVVGTTVSLANGGKAFAVLANVSLQHAQATRHFLSIKLESRGEWFCLGRYHDIDAISHGPAALADFLGLKTDQVFPIGYDIRAFATGLEEVLVGMIPAIPSERLSKEELMDLVFAENV